MFLGDLAPLSPSTLQLKRSVEVDSEGPEEKTASIPREVA